MTTVDEITGAVKRLPKKDLARFRKWFVQYDATIWDLADQSYALLKSDPSHPSLHFKKISRLR